MTNNGTLEDLGTLKNTNKLTNTNLIILPDGTSTDDVTDKYKITNVGNNAKVRTASGDWLIGGLEAGPTAPEKPVLADGSNSITKDSITLKAEEGNEYAISTDPDHWVNPAQIAAEKVAAAQAENKSQEEIAKLKFDGTVTFSGLEYGTEYTFYARVAETNTREASASSEGATFTTLTVAIPNAPAVAITSPVMGAEPQTDGFVSDENANYTASVQWETVADDGTATAFTGAKFLGDTVYQAVITLTPKHGYEFADSVTTAALTVDGTEEDPTVTREKDGSLTLTRTFKQTVSTKLESIKIKTEPKADYRPGAVPLLHRWYAHRGGLRQ
jgi:hypothetical protein